MLNYNAFVTLYSKDPSFEPIENVEASMSKHDGYNIVLYILYKGYSIFINKKVPPKYYFICVDELEITNRITILKKLEDVDFLEQVDFIQ